MSRNSGVVLVAAHCIPSIGWYDINRHLDYSCPVVSPPGVYRLAIFTGTLWENAEDIKEEFSIHSDLSSQQTDRRTT